MSDEDDFVTVNITCNQAGALAVALTTAAKLGVFDLLSDETNHYLASFVKMLKMEIASQKTGIQPNNKE